MIGGFNRIYKLIIFDEKDNIVSVCEYCDFSAFYHDIDRLMVHDYTDLYEYKEEFVDCKEGCLYISIKKKLSVDF